jgi:hypothetical protein
MAATIHFQSSPLSLALQPTKSRYEQLIEWLKNICMNFQPSWVSGAETRHSVSPIGFRDLCVLGDVDLTSVRLEHQVQLEIKDAIEGLYVAHFSACLGAHAAERLTMLLECKTGWDGCDAAALNLASLNIASHFVSTFDLREKEVGVFMSRDGNIVLNWPRPNDHKIVEIEFFPDCYSLYVGGNEDADFFDFGDTTFMEAVAQAI